MNNYYEVAEKLNADINNMNNRMDYLHLRVMSLDKNISDSEEKIRDINKEFGYMSLESLSLRRFVVREEIQKQLLLLEMIDKEQELFITENELTILNHKNTSS